MKVYINPGHDVTYDPGACGYGMREADVVAVVGAKLKEYLEAVGYECRILQSDNLAGESWYKDRPVAVVHDANNWDADLFVSLHCNAFNGAAKGTECEVYCLTDSHGNPTEAYKLAQCIQDQLIATIETVDRGVKKRQDLIVLNSTDMPAVLVEIAFIDNEKDANKLRFCQDEIARAIARGFTDYESK